MNAYIVVCNGAAWRIKADGYHRVTTESSISSVEFCRDEDREQAYVGGRSETVTERSHIAFISGTQVVVLQEDCLDPPPGPTDKPTLASVITHPAAKAD